MNRYRLHIQVALALGLAALATLALLCLLSGLPIARGVEGSRALATELTVCPAGPPTCGFSTIQAAVDAASNGDVIKIATGTYTDVHWRPVPPGYPAHIDFIPQVVYISKSITLRGGYTTAFTDPPDPDANPTTLDALRHGRVLLIAGDISPTVEGLRLTGGYANGLGGYGGSWPDHIGGGIYVIGATAAFSGNTVFKNAARYAGPRDFSYGGGLYLYQSDATLSGNIIISNSASYGGGLCANFSRVALTKNTISFNTAEWSGGGLYLWASDTTLDSNTVSTNTAGLGSGGGLGTSLGDITLIGNTVSANTASLGGGGIMLSGSVGDARLVNNTISFNAAHGLVGVGVGQGGGLSIGGYECWLSGNTIFSNTAGVGGGLRIHHAVVTFTNNVIARNHGHAAGSGLYIYLSSARLIHNTLSRNSGGDGSAVYVADVWGTNFSDVAMTNTILVSHTVGISVTAGNTVTLAGTLWGGGVWANESDWGGSGSIITGTVNIWGDPDFADSSSGDYHIGASSAALDIGVDADLSDDIDGDPRPMGHGPDIGADELRIALMATKRVSHDPVQAGERLTYTLHITNTGDLTLSATISDLLPDHCTPSGILTWTPTIPAARVWTEQVVVTAEEGYSGTLVNLLQVSTQEGVTGTSTATCSAVSTEHLIYLPLLLCRSKK